MKHVKSMLGVAAVLFALGGAAQVAAESPREDAMKEMGKSMKAIKDLISAGGPAADATDPAKKIAEIAAKIPDLFPQGSDTPDDEAKADIWQNWDDFTAKGKSLQDEANLLVSAAGGGDIATVGAQFEKVGGACGACHKAYREKTN
ncbi:cytochrome c [Dongia sp.]|uniref:c-type cytochrome n=1 Tax=Dongia sp. TaxID=1977262 RepID=UPI0035B11C78